MAKLSPAVEEVARIIGREQALTLVSRLPTCGVRPWRRTCYVPKTLRPDHWLVEVLGWESAQKLVRGWGGMWLELSKCSHLVLLHRARAIRAEHERGTSPRVIAVLFDLHPDQVRNILTGRIMPEDSTATPRHSRLGRR